MTITLETSSIARFLITNSVNNDAKEAARKTFFKTPNALFKIWTHNSRTRLNSTITFCNNTLKLNSRQKLPASKHSYYFGFLTEEEKPEMITEAETQTPRVGCGRDAVVHCVCLCVRWRSEAADGYRQQGSHRLPAVAHNWKESE